MKLWLCNVWGLPGPPSNAVGPKMRPVCFFDHHPFVYINPLSQSFLFSSSCSLFLVNMLSSVRRPLTAKAISSSNRFYTVIPFTPSQQQQHQQPPLSKEEDQSNPIHALYNTENQSMLDKQHYEIHSGDQKVSELGQVIHSADSFSPSFNTVFDE